MAAGPGERRQPRRRRHLPRHSVVVTDVVAVGARPELDSPCVPLGHARLRCLDRCRRGGGPVDLVAQRRRLTELIRLWGLERPNVIAHDIGGAVALGAHLLEGVEFASLHLSDIVTLPPWGSPFFRHVADNESVFAALPPPLHQALVHAYITGAGGPDFPQGWVDELTRPWSTPDGQAAFYAQIAALSPVDTEPISERLGQVRCPVRIGWGEDDPWLPVEQAGRLAEALPGPVDVTRFPGVGHLAVLEAPEAFAAEVTAWLTISSA